MNEDKILIDIKYVDQINRSHIFKKWLVKDLKLYVKQNYFSMKDLPEVNLIYCGRILNEKEHINELFTDNFIPVVFVVLTTLNPHIDYLNLNESIKNTWNCQQYYLNYYNYMTHLSYWNYLTHSQFIQNQNLNNKPSNVVINFRPRQLIGHSLSFLQNLINNNAGMGNQRGNVNQNIEINNQQQNINLNIDWLDWAYTFLRLVILFSILYFYSSVNRFLVVLSFSTILFLYQAGLLFMFRRQRINPINDPNQIPVIDNQNLDRPQAQDNQNGVNETESSFLQQQNATEVPNRYAQVLAQYPNIQRLSNGVWKGTKLFANIIATFFTSLIPERPPPIDLN